VSVEVSIKLGGQPFTVTLPSHVAADQFAKQIDQHGGRVVGIYERQRRGW
jgi:hypothetical protein